MQSTKEANGHDHNEGAARSGCSLRASDEALESEDEGIHLWRAQRNLHHRPAEDAQAIQRRVEVCHRAVRQRQDDSVCRHQAPGAGCRGRRGQPRGDAVHQPALAGRPADQLGDGAEECKAPSGTGRDGHGWPLRAADQEGSDQAGAGAQAPAGEPGRHQDDEAAAGCACLSWTRTTRRLP